MTRYLRDKVQPYLKLVEPTVPQPLLQGHKTLDGTIYSDVMGVTCSISTVYEDALSYVGEWNDRSISIFLDTDKETIYNANMTVRELLESKDVNVYIGGCHIITTKNSV